MRVSGKNGFLSRSMIVLCVLGNLDIVSVSPSCQAGTCSESGCYLRRTGNLDSSGRVGLGWTSGTVNVHVDAVRDVKVSDNGGFLSCSMTIKANHRIMKERTWILDQSWRQQDGVSALTFRCTDRSFFYESQAQYE